MITIGQTTHMENVVTCVSDHMLKHMTPIQDNHRSGMESLFWSSFWIMQFGTRSSTGTLDWKSFGPEHQAPRQRSRHADARRTKAAGANLARGWRTWPDGPRQRSFTDKIRSRRLTRPAWELTWPNRARHCSDSVKNRPQVRAPPAPWPVTAVSRTVGPG